VSLLQASARQAAILEKVAHRPWPLPVRPWLLAQTLEQVLLAHWRVEPDALEPLLPNGTEPDVHDGSGWLSIVALRVAGVRLRGTLPAPFVSSFHQLNVRTYATSGGKPGIVFLGLDASSALAAEVARRVYGLPFHRARIDAAPGRFESARVGAEGVAFSAVYRPHGPSHRARPGSLEEFLVERYRLFTSDGRRADIHHLPWPLRGAEGAVELATVSPVPLEGEPILQYADRIDVLIWGLELLERALGG